MKKIFCLRAGDKILIFIILGFSIILAGLVILLNPNTENSEVVIRIENKLVKKIPLENLEISKQYEFEFNNNIGYIEMKNGKVRMLVMDRTICPEAICSNTGWIDKSYQSIVCLPNKIIVTIEGKKEAVTEIDMIVE